MGRSTRTAIKTRNVGYKPHEGCSGFRAGESASARLRSAGPSGVSPSTTRDAAFRRARVEACAADAVRGLEGAFAYRDAAALGQRVIDALDRAGRPPAVDLLRRTGEICVTTGEVDAAHTLYERGLAALATARSKDRPVDPFDEGALTLAQARLLVQRGDPDAALPLFERVKTISEQQGETKNAAITLGDIARLRAAKGEVDQALQMHQQKLEIMQALGDRRSAAITLGDIANLRARAGEIEQALEMKQQELQVYEELEDIASKAATLWEIAQIELARENYAEALPRMVEAYEIVTRTGRLEGICVIGATFGQLLVAAGQRNEGLVVLRRSADGYRRLGRPADAEQVEALIRQIEQGGTTDP